MNQTPTPPPPTAQRTAGQAAQPEAPSPESEQQDRAIHLPSVRECVKRSGEHIVVGAVIPAVTFYAVLSLVDLRWALVASLLWSYLLITGRLLARKKVPGVIILSAGLITARFVAGFITNSAFVYFLQPSLGNFCIAVLLLASLVPGKPLTRRLANDFCALPAALDAHPHIARFFSRLTLLWAIVCAFNGAATIVLLLHVSLGSFIALRPVFSYGLVAAGIVVSYRWFRATVRGQGMRIVFGRAPAAVPPA